MLRLPSFSLPKELATACASSALSSTQDCLRIKTALPSAVFLEVEYVDNLNAFTDVLAIFAMRKIGIIYTSYMKSVVTVVIRYIDSYKGIETVAI